MCAGNYIKKLNWFILFLGEMQLAALGRFKQPVLGEVTQSSTTRPLTQHKSNSIVSFLKILKRKIGILDLKC